MVMFFTLKEIIFESQVIDAKIKTDILVVSAVAIIFTVVLIAGIVKVSVFVLKILYINYKRKKVLMRCCKIILCLFCVLKTIVIIIITKCSIIKTMRSPSRKLYSSVMMIRLYLSRNN